MTTPRHHAAPEGGCPPGPRRERGGLADLPGTLAFGVLVVVALLVMLMHPAWGQEPTTPETPADVWQSVGMGMGFLLAGVGTGVAVWLKVVPERRQQPDHPPPLTATEIRAMITEAIARVQTEGDAQHRRIRETLRELEARLLRAEERITTNEHASAERRAEMAREMGEIASDVRHLIKALE